MATLRGILTLVLMGLNLLFWIIPLYLVALLRLLPVPRLRVACAQALVRIAQNWIAGNNLIFRLTQDIHWDVEGVEALPARDWYLVVCNHQSWVDILALQGVFNRRIPFLKFFLKQQLIRVPLLGWAWWALDFPFMKRHSREHLERHPEARGQDLEATRRACEHFRHKPTSVMNFVEGTRFTLEKHAAQDSPYRHLLKPRAGGIAFVLGAMGDILHRLLDVTIVYPDGAPSFWDLCCGRLRKIIVRVQVREIPAWTTQGDYQEDEAFRARLQAWLGEMWTAKDAEIERLQARAASA
ncbi:acyltransferase [Thioalkalivibrio sp. XN279]|uniref:acyltransferase n=1 Tax=Thioalkalivibrio sp. XN279 TaxID=2714953 RepID=UPI00140BFD89|nr:acyltransferase [Thioalkalivibrio sp. XN279]NHA13702.1 acyltransferase [Thioalkalivibrio sp. XN279]